MTGLLDGLGLWLGDRLWRHGTWRPTRILRIFWIIVFSSAVCVIVIPFSASIGVIEWGIGAVFASVGLALQNFWKE